MTRSEIVNQLLPIFRRYGYEGTTISKISEATGLGKASLYHHFPKGKEEMAKAVLEHLQQWRQIHVIDHLLGAGTPLERLLAMTESMRLVYEQGRQSCLLSILSMGDSKDSFSAQIQPAFERLIEAIAVVLVDAGFSKQDAHERAEDAILQIQGALVLSRALDNNASFIRTMARLPYSLLNINP
jgi:TetR/AcrR family transcriptional repressor of lmrAB and yxaGH operons